MIMSSYNPLMILISSFMITINCRWISTGGSDKNFFEDSEYLWNAIVGGSPTEPSNYPYIVSLQVNGYHFCAGSLLRKEYPAAVLTAAHCYKNPKYDDVVVRVYAQNSDAPFHPDTNKYIDFRVEAMVEHPDYNDNSLDNDIMILYLEEYGTYNHKKRLLNSFSFIETVTIESNQIASTTEGNLECCQHDQDLQVIGYGNDCSECANTPTLEYADIGYISRDICREYMGQRVTDSMNCAAHLYDGREDSCQGDSGAPLIVKGTNKQIGVVSWGYACAVPGYPGVYTDVGLFYDWIQDHIAPETHEQKLNVRVDGGETALERLSGDNYWFLVVLVVSFVGGIWYCYKNGCIFQGYSKDMYQPILLPRDNSV